jgi:tetratricopeptide (TPR) repeat protein
MTHQTATRSRQHQFAGVLLGELEAGRFDSAITRKIVEGPAAIPRLLRASFLAEHRLFARARADIVEALRVAHEHPLIEMVAGLLSFVTRDHQRSLDLLAASARHSPRAAPRARQLALRAAGMLGWEQDVRGLLEQAIAHEPGKASWHVQAVRFYLRGACWERALDHARRALEIEPGHAALWMETAGLHAALDQRPEALEALDRALALAPDQERTAFLREAGRVAIDAGDLPRAISCIEEALSRDPDQPALHVRLAEIAAWRDDRDGARAHAERALARSAEHPAALRVLGGLEARAGQWEAASVLLDRAIALDPTDSQAHLWRAEVCIRMGRLAEAQAPLHRAIANAGGFLFTAWLLRFLIAVQEGEFDGVDAVPIPRTEEFEPAVRELAPALAARAFETRAVPDVIAAVEAAIEALRGNRSILATHVVDGALVRLHSRGGCRYESRRALHLLRVVTPADCLARLDEVVEAYPGSSLPTCHRGELHLWLGHWAEARRDLEQAVAINHGTRWAYMGLSMLDLREDAPAQSLATNAHGVQIMRNTEGPAVYTFRGEALRRLGRLDEAIVELEKALASHSSRASAAINLALIFAAKGDRVGLGKLWSRLTVEQAVGLMSDAADELGLTIVGDGDWQPALDEMVAVLEKALSMMGGNRASGLLTYWRGDHLRFVPHWPHGNSGPHDRDHELLAQARQLLLGSPG